LQVVRKQLKEAAKIHWKMQILRNDWINLHNILGNSTGLTLEKAIRVADDRDNWRRLVYDATGLRMAKEHLQHKFLH